MAELKFASRAGRLLPEIQGPLRAASLTPTGWFGHLADVAVGRIGQQPKGLCPPTP
jgi:hypothetical protein